MQNLALPIASTSPPQRPPIFGMREKLEHKESSPAALASGQAREGLRICRIPDMLSDRRLGHDHHRVFCTLVRPSYVPSFASLLHWGGLRASFRG